MTAAQNSPDSSPAETPLTTSHTLPFDPADLVRGIRVRPAQFARMCGVSRQAVSQWVKAGKILLYPDGTFDPAVAARRVIEYTDPGRLRAKVFRVISNDASTMRGRINQLEVDMSEAQQLAAYHEKFSRDTEFEYDTFHELLEARAGELVAANTPEQVRAILSAAADAAEVALVARDDARLAPAHTADELGCGDLMDDGIRAEYEKLLAQGIVQTPALDSLDDIDALD